MKKKFVFGIVCLVPLFSFSQKFMIEENGDTVLYREKMVAEGTDTSFEAPANTFEIKNGVIINREIGRPVGYWEIKNSDGTISKGMYSDAGELTGTWRTYDADGILKSEKEYIPVGKDDYLVKDVEYRDGRKVILVDKPWFLKFYLGHVLLISILIVGAFFIRIPLNKMILSREYGEPAWQGIGIKRLPYIFTVNFKLWWKNLSPRNRFLGSLSNFLTVLSLAAFLGVIVGLAFCGGLH